jgi:hypothetical protein
MPRRCWTYTPAQREARHAEAVAAGDFRLAGSMRYQARCVAAERGAPAPSWALPRVGEHASARHPNQRPHPNFRRPLPELVAADVPSVPTTIPSELTTWRRKNPGSVIHISRAGVVLRTFREQRAFPDVQSALAAVAHQ